MPNAKSKWEHYLASLVADRREVVLEWFEGRPPKVRAPRRITIRRSRAGSSSVGSTYDESLSDLQTL
jgi:hypothetical protein